MSNLDYKKLIEMMYSAAQQDWRPAVPNHPTQAVVEEKLFAVGPDSCGCFYGRSHCVCYLRVNAITDSSFHFAATFESIDDGCVPLLGPYESMQSALARMGRFKTLMVKESYVPSLDQMKEIAQKCGIYLSL
jgi:hypothetical protein